MSRAYVTTFPSFNSVCHRSRRANRKFHGTSKTKIIQVIVSSSSNLGEFDGDDVWDHKTFEFTRFLEVAIDAAHEGGQIMRKFGSEGADIVKTKQNTRDLLTVYDGQVQDVIVKRIRDNFPAHRILGEENVEPGADAATRATEEAFALNNSNNNNTDDDDVYVWIIDPIDGTTNFVHGMPLSAISIGIASLKTREVVVGVIYDPFRREMFHAVKGKGAFMDATKISVDDCSKIDDCLVATGYAPTEASSKFLLNATTNLTKYPVRSIRMLGSAAIMLAWVACGRVSCYIEESLNAWDTAAGALLVKEAGGIFTDFSNKEYEVFTRETLASSGNLEVHELLRRATQ